MAEISNVAVAGHVVDGITLQLAAGDLKKSIYFKGLNLADVEELKTAIEGTGEFTVTGFGVTYRDKAIKEGTTPITSGTGEKVDFQQVILQRTADVGGQEVKMQSMYITLPVPQDTVKKAALKTALLNKTIGGAKVTDVSVNMVKSLG